MGTDGYYYVVQVEDLLTLGRLHVPDASWVHRFLALCAFVGGDPIFGIKVGTALLAAVCVPAAWWLGRRVAPSSWGAWLLAGWAAASPTLTHLGGDFPKNLGVVAPLLFVLGWVAKLEHRQRWGLHALGAMALLATLAAHRVGAVLGLLAIAGAAAGHWLSSAQIARRVLLIALGAVILFFVASAYLPNLLHWMDLTRIAGQLQLELGIPGPFAYLSLRPTPWSQVIELSLGWLALGAGSIAWWRESSVRPSIGAALVPLTLCLLPIWRTDVLDLGYRLSLMSPFLAAPLLVTTIRVPSLPRPIVPVLIAAGVGLALWTPGRGYDPKDTPPYETYRELIGRIPRPLPDLLIAHQGINFLYDHETGHEAMAWAPEPDLDRRTVGRLAFGINAGEWLDLQQRRPGFPRPVHLDGDYTYVREDAWEALVGLARYDDDDEVLERIGAWQNPTRTRPASMLRHR